MNRGCDKCNISVLPYRAKHCDICRRCVRKYDHHCFWVGGCVGELNHGKFLVFVTTQSFTLFGNIWISLGTMSMIHEKYKDDEQMATHVMGIFQFWAFFSTIFLMLTGGLMIYHCFLVATA